MQNKSNIFFALFRVFLIKVEIHILKFLGSLDSDHELSRAIYNVFAGQFFITTQLNISFNLEECCCCCTKAYWKKGNVSHGATKI